MHLANIPQNQYRVLWSNSRKQMLDNETFAQKLQFYRKQLGLTQEHLAEKLNVSRVAVSKWESGRGFPNLDSLKGMSDLFGISIDELLSGRAISNFAKSYDGYAAKNLIGVLLGLVDFSAILFFVLPVFALRSVSSNSELIIKSVNLFVLCQNLSPASLMLATVSAISILFGVVELAFQNARRQKVKAILLVLSFCSSLILIASFEICNQPYPCLLGILLIALKAILFVKVAYPTNFSMLRKVSQM